MLLCENHTLPVTSCWFIPNTSDKFITTCEDGTIRIWDSNNYSVSSRFVAPIDKGAAGAASLYAHCAIFTDEIIISGWNDGRIRAYRVDNSQLLWSIENAH